MSDEQKKVDDFCERLFSGRDLLTIMDEAQIGVGATIHCVEGLDHEIARPSTTYRQWDFPSSLKASDVKKLVETAEGLRGGAFFP